MPQCAKCQIFIDAMDIFSQGECLDCHEKEFDIINLAAEEVKNSFIKAIN